MTAVTQEALAAVAQRARSRSLANTPTRGRYISTFTDGAITGGATWMYSRPDGRVFMVRVSPRRVWMDLQAAIGGALGRPLRVDGIVGPETMAALEAFTRSAPGTPLVAMLPQALLRVYHSGVGTLVIPSPVQLPSPGQLVTVTGDTSHHSIIDLTGTQDAPAVSVPRVTTAASLREDYDREIKRVEALLAQPPAPPPAAPAPAPAPVPAPVAPPAAVAPAPSPVAPVAPAPAAVEKPATALQVVAPAGLTGAAKCEWFRNAQRSDPSIVIPPECRDLSVPKRGEVGFVEPSKPWTTGQKQAVAVVVAAVVAVAVGAAVWANDKAKRQQGQYIPPTMPMNVRSNPSRRRKRLQRERDAQR